MKGILKYVIAFLSVFLLTSCVAQKVTVGDILENPELYNGKTVSVTGDIVIYGGHQEKYDVEYTCTNDQCSIGDKFYLAYKVKFYILNEGNKQIIIAAATSPSIFKVDVKDPPDLPIGTTVEITGVVTQTKDGYPVIEVDY